MWRLSPWAIPWVRTELGQLHARDFRLATRLQTGHSTALPRLGCQRARDGRKDPPSPPVAGVFRPGSSFRRIVMLLRRATRSLLWSAAAVLLPAFAGGQGFALNEIGSCAISRGFAATGGACMDASLIFWNPAGLSRLSGGSALVGASMINLKGKFVRDTTQKEF